MTSPRDAYEKRRNRMLLPLAGRLEAHLKSVFDGCERIDRISVGEAQIRRPSHSDPGSARSKDCYLTRAMWRDSLLP
jgi:hypothetical protein